MSELNLLGEGKKVKRDYDARAKEKTPEVIATARQYGREFFDGERVHGYGGYRYDGRWVSVAERFIKHYNLPENAAILDIGCAKGFLLHDFKKLLPKATVAGIDVSEYALDHAMDSVKPYLLQSSAEILPFPDKSFDLVISINTIHNLPQNLLEQSLREMERVSKGGKYISVDAWRNDREKENLKKWVLTAETTLHVDDWKALFEKVGYRGDYWWFIAD